MKKDKKKKPIIYLIISATIIGTVVCLIYVILHSPKNITKKGVDPINPVIKDEESTSGRNSEKYQKTTENNAQSTTLKAPILSKSSGNNGPVPAGVVIEYVCQTTAGTTCDIELTNQTTSQVIRLGKKTTTDGQGGSGAIWTWTSIAGSWKVKAINYNDNSNNESASQELKVQ